ncbi:hypothetical protein B0H10DRAFT_2007212 [Mycena sp. CBHHK59/15]|nr:hypothetical protein B0H10DRAFT_2007212 [Mycena sp. CBHHK59/15]
MSFPLLPSLLPSAASMSVRLPTSFPSPDAYPCSPSFAAHHSPPLLSFSLLAAASIPCCIHRCIVCSYPPSAPRGPSSASLCRPLRRLFFQCVWWQDWLFTTLSSSSASYLSSISVLPSHFLSAPHRWAGGGARLPCAHSYCFRLLFIPLPPPSSFSNPN